ncbi:L-fuculokinase [Bacillota bacterium Meth-B3]
MYIGLDVGTSGCKAAVIGASGAILKTASREYAFERPRPGWVELNPGAVWAAACETLASLAPESALARAIAVASIGEAQVMLDEWDRPVMNAIVYLDTRAAEMAGEVRARFDPRELYKITGVPVNQMYSLCKQLWLKRNRPELIERARRIFLLGDYLTYKLSGECAVDSATASRTMMFDVDALDWSLAVFERFELSRMPYSRVVPTGTVVGRILPDVAESCALPREMRVVVGAHDQVMATLGSGVVEPGDLLMGEGSSESLNLVVSADQLRRDRLFRREICIEPFVEPGRFLLPIGQLSHGTSIKWFIEANRHAYEAEAAGDTLYAAAERLCAPDSGQLYFLPYLSGVNCMDAGSRAPASFIGIDSGTSVHSMYRAVLEGLSFETLSNMGLFCDAGVSVNRIVASGGGTKSRLLMQIKADALKRPIELSHAADSGVMGLAMVCARALGEIGSYREAAAAFVRTRDKIAPERDLSERYGEYLRLSGALKALFRNAQS